MEGNAVQLHWRCSPRLFVLSLLEAKDQGRSTETWRSRRQELGWAVFVRKSRLREDIKMWGKQWFRWQEWQERQCPQRRGEGSGTPVIQPGLEIKTESRYTGVGTGKGLPDFKTCCFHIYLPALTPGANSFWTMKSSWCVMISLLLSHASDPLAPRQWPLQFQFKVVTPATTTAAYPISTGDIGPVWLNSRIHLADDPHRRQGNAKRWHSDISPFFFTNPLPFHQTPRDLWWQVLDSWDMPELHWRNLSSPLFVQMEYDKGSGVMVGMVNYMTIIFLCVTCLTKAIDWAVLQE